MWALQPVVPVLRPVLSLMYQYEAPFVMDDAAARADSALSRRSGSRSWQRRRRTDVRCAPARRGQGDR